MRYMSTRGGVKDIPFKETVLMGLADDGGLMIPEYIPRFDKNGLMTLQDKSYQELAFDIMSKFISDIPTEDLKALIEKSYGTFDTAEIVPVVSFDNFYLAELYHGPTYAFKDVALQFLGNLFEYILNEKDEKLNIIGATSGDTGSAAIYGVKGKKGVKIFILHPKGKVSRMQELQMTTVLDNNVYNLAVKGTFDDCQRIVKDIFGDVEFKKRNKLGSINSINWARVLAQIVYYFYSYFRTEEAKDYKKINFVVPTGNFGNILAGFYAKMMGLPVNKLIIATNENNILYRFVKNGDYSIKNVVETYSPSMDIQIASNFERYLYYLYEGDTEKVGKSMKQLKEDMKITFSERDIEKTQEIFDATTTENLKNLETIKKVYDLYGYVIDPHTACGVDAVFKLKDKYDEKFIALSTAHPAKFFDVVEKATGITPEFPENLKNLEGKEKRVFEMENDTLKVKNFIEQNI